MLRRLLSAAAVILPLAACNFAPDSPPPLIATPATFKESGPWQAAQPSDGLPHGTWWQAFGDPTLDRLEPELDRDNPSLAATVARYDQARAYAAEAEAGLYPQLDAGGSITANRQSADRPLRGIGGPNEYGANQLDAEASYEIDLWGKLHNTAAAGRDQAQASAAELAGMRLSLEAELATDYLTLRGLDADARLLDDTVAAYQKALDLTQTRLAGAIASGMDVSRAETQLDTVRAQLSDIAGRRALMEHAIATLVGESASGFSVPPAVVTVAMPDLPVGLPSTLLQRRPDIAAAERQVAAANAEIGVARAAFYPSVSLGLTGGFQSTSFNLLSMPYSFWSLGPSVSLPILNGGALDAEESSAYAKFREMSQSYRGTVLAAFQEVEDNLALLHWLGREAVDEDAGVGAAQRTLDIAMNLYQQGADSYLEVVTAQTALLQLQQASIDLRTRRQEAEVGLVRALGGGWRATDLPSDAQSTELAANTTSDAAQGTDVQN